eukprot:TRINITY_DN3928_c0_g1_i2.p1 TRINITY_DN3928_c0_g1~~TRINITY_DN3928_c0_g1_i2.p1  ORF type:complete len:494 (-),score=74.24 TRINITY_DN3928_c0_g1_i2:7-1488(-)
MMHRMVKQWWMMAVLCLFTTGGSHSREEPDGWIEHLTSEQLNLISVSPAKVPHPLLVSFDLGWCGRARHLRQELAQLHAEFPGIHVARLDISKHPTKRTAFNVRKSPTLMLFRPGAVPFQFHGPHTQVAIKSFARKMTAPTVVVLESVEAVKAFLKGPGPVALGVFMLVQDEIQEAVFRAVAPGLMLHGSFGIINDPNILFKMALNSGTTRVIHPYFKTEEYTGSWALEDFQAWIQRRIRANLIDIRTVNYAELVTAKAGAVFVFAHNHADVEQGVWNPLEDTIIQLLVPRKLVYKLKWVAVDWELNAALGHKLGVQVPSLGQPAAVFVKSSRIFPLKPLANQTLTAERIEELLKPLMGTELPDPVLTDPVLTAARARAPGADILVKFYTTWCSFCWKFETLWSELASTASVEQHVLASKLVMVEYDIGTFPEPAIAADLNGVPALVLYRPQVNGSLEPLVFSGNRTLKDIVKFLHANCSSPIIEGRPPTDEL